MGIYVDFQRENKTLIVNSKNDLLQFIEMRRVFTLLQLFLIRKLDMEKVYEVTDNMTVTINTDTVRLKLYPDEVEAYRSSFQWAVLSHFTVNIFEGVKRYCQKTHQLDKMKKQEWFLYFKTLRHSFSHDNRWAFRDIPHDKFPITYHNITLDHSLNDEPMSSSHYNVYVFWDLTKGVSKFVRDELK